jgi:hypothetical protein
MSSDASGPSVAVDSNLHESNPEKLINRIDDSFDDDAQVIKYMEWVRSTMLDYVQSVKRNAALLLLLIAAFELVADARGNAFSVGSFRIARGSIVLTFLPPIASFLYYQAILDTIKTNRLRATFCYLLYRWCPGAAENGMADLLNGPEPVYWNTRNLANDIYFDKIDRLELRFDVISTNFVQLGLLAFEVQAYWVLFSAHGTRIVTWAISLCVALVFLTFSAALGIFSTKRFRDDTYLPADGKHRREASD